MKSVMIIIAILIVAGLFYFGYKKYYPNGYNQTSSATSTIAPSTQTAIGQNAVTIQNMSFQPVSLTIVKGTTVTWTNNDTVAHTVTSNSGVFDSGNLNPGQTFQKAFDTAGTYLYHCTVHPSMTGTIIVQ